MRRPSVEVLETVASAKGTDPAELEAVLFEAVDPHALDKLFAGRPETTGTVRFVFAGYEVTVEATGAVTATARDE